MHLATCGIPDLSSSGAACDRPACLSATAPLCSEPGQEPAGGHRHSGWPQLLQRAAFVVGAEEGGGAGAAVAEGAHGVAGAAQSHTHVHAVGAEDVAAQVGNLEVGGGAWDS